MADNENNSDYTTAYANWNPFYDDMFTEIKEIRAFGNKALFDIDNTQLHLNLYYSRIVNFFSTHSQYVKDYDTIEKKLNRIEEFLFSSEYLRALNEKKHDLTRPQRRIIKDLRKIFQIMCRDISDNGLSPKMVEQNRKASQNKNLTEEEREELEALEEIGVM